MVYQDFNPNTRLQKNADKFEIPVSTLSALSRSFVYTFSDGVKLRGLDLSHWNANENLDPKVLKANGIDFVILKVTEGTGFVDSTFEYKYKAFLEAGIIVLPYHFFRGNYGGADQAKHCVNTLRSLGFLDAIEYVPIIWADVESSDGVTIDQRRNRLLAFLQTVEGLGFQGGVYSSPYYWNSLIGSVGWIANYWQWVAHWSSVAYPTLPLGWTKEKTLFWQNGIHPAHSWVEEVIGAKGNVDHNYFFGDLSYLKEILKFPTTPPPGNGECTCDEELARLEEEMNFLKLEVYNLQQFDLQAKEIHEKLGEEVTGLGSRVTSLEQQVSDLEIRLSALETLLLQLKNILCQ